jgi:hypothetical protein
MKLKELSIDTEFKVGGIQFKLIYIENGMGYCLDCMGSIIGILLETTVDG